MPAHNQNGTGKPLRRTTPLYNKQQQVACEASNGYLKLSDPTTPTTIDHRGDSLWQLTLIIYAITLVDVVARDVLGVYELNGVELPGNACEDEYTASSTISMFWSTMTALPGDP